MFVLAKNEIDSKHVISRLRKCGYTPKFIESALHIMGAIQPYYVMLDGFKDRDDWEDIMTVIESSGGTECKLIGIDWNTPDE